MSSGALVDHEIKIDSSIFKYGRRKGIVNFDYSRANSPIVPWRVKEDDMCSRDDTGYLWELPIYSEKRWIGAFVTSNRIFRAFMSLRHKFHQAGQSSQRNQTGCRPGRDGWLASVSPGTQERDCWPLSCRDMPGKQTSTSAEANN